MNEFSFNFARDLIKIKSNLLISLELHDRN
jgi:hypothetical protein